MTLREFRGRETSPPVESLQWPFDPLGPLWPMGPSSWLLLAPSGSSWLLQARGARKGQEEPRGQEGGPKDATPVISQASPPPRKRVPINDPHNCEHLCYFLQKMTYKTLSFMLVEEILGAGVFIIHFVFPFLLCGEVSLYYHTSTYPSATVS